MAGGNAGDSWVLVVFKRKMMVMEEGGRCGAGGSLLMGVLAVCQRKGDGDVE